MEKSHGPWPVSASNETKLDMLLLLRGRGAVGNGDDRRGGEGERAVGLLDMLAMLLGRKPLSILLPLAAVPTPAILPKPNSAKSSTRDSPRV